MADPIPYDEHAKRLKIRARPKPVTRINRKVLMAGAAIGFLALVAATNIALKPPRAVEPGASQELYNTKNTRRPEALSSLPASYSDVPRLGPPLAGDLGSTVLQAERELGIEPAYIDSYQNDFRVNAEDEAERARRMREAALAEEAQRAPVFFRMQSQTQRAPDAQTSTAGLPASLGSELMALAARPPSFASGMIPGVAAGHQDANFQDRKRAFASDPSSGDIYNPHEVQTPASPYQVMAGTLIPASLITGINSDLPGTIIAQVTQPVYDTVSGHHLLIPQGTRLLGRYQSEISFGQNRALVIWERLIFPDGSSLVIAAPGTDALGRAGVSDRTDHHWDRFFAAAGLATLLGIGAELSNDDDDLTRAIRRGAGDTFNQAGQRVVERNLGIQPTIRIRPGWTVRVLVTRDLILRPH